MTRLFLIRHGQVVNHHERRYNGHHDVDITEHGVEQMVRLRDALKVEALGAIYSSDLQRSVKGAAIIGNPFGLEHAPIEAFRELALGRWEGFTRDEAVEKFPEEAHFTFSDLATDKVQGGESLIDLSARVLPALEEIVEGNSDTSVCVVAHGGVNRVILCDAMGLGLKNFFRIEQDYGCLNIIDYHPDGIKVVKLLNGGPNSNTNSTELY